jgi:UDP-N-acetylmuramoyl-tripeptide--D-alanyl-D-alanine ligase
MYRYLIKTKAFFVRFRDPIQSRLNNQSFWRLTLLGINKLASNVNISNVKTNPFVEIYCSSFVIKSNLLGLYNANQHQNAALAIGRIFWVNDYDIKRRISIFR